MLVLVAPLLALIVHRGVRTNCRRVIPTVVTASCLAAGNSVSLRAERSGGLALHMLGSDAACALAHVPVSPPCSVFLLGRKILLIRPKMEMANDGNYRSMLLKKCCCCCCA